MAQCQDGWERGVLDEIERWNRLGDRSSRIFHAPQAATETHASFTIHTRSGLRGVLGVLVPNEHSQAFKDHFRPFFDQRGILCLDNLIHLCMIVKDAATHITSMIEANLPWIDRWTVVDIGSTDATPESVHAVMEKHGLLPFGSIHTKPFRDFAQARNDCLDIAQGSFPCTTYLMMDDTHLLYANPYTLRQFVVHAIRDQAPTSLSLLVRLGDAEYASNCISVTPPPALRYTHPVHECLQHEHNDRRILIPAHIAHIVDRSSSNGMVRLRLEKGLEWLADLVHSQPHEPRHTFYLAETLLAVGRVDEAREWYERRVRCERGSVQERFMSHLRLALMEGEREREQLSPHYSSCIDLDDKRPEPYFFMAMHHHRNENGALGFSIMRKAFEVGYPTHCHFQLNPILSFVLVPFHLVAMCMAPWEELGHDHTTYPIPDVEARMDMAIEALLRFKQSSKTYECVRNHPLFKQMLLWEEIIRHVRNYKAGRQSLPPHFPVETPPPPPLTRQRWAMILPDASGAEGKGQGSHSREFTLDTEAHRSGSIYDWAAHLAIALAEKGIELWIFCKCDTITMPESSQSITLIPIQGMWPSLIAYHFNTIILSDNEHYLPALYRTNCSSIILTVHSPLRANAILVFCSKLTAIVPRTMWHFDQIREVFQQSPDLDEVLAAPMPIQIPIPTPVLQRPRPPPSPHLPSRHSFIFNSPPEHGLAILLDMWPLILSNWPDARLEIHTDLDEAQRQNVLRDTTSIVVCAWAGQEVMREAWERARFWVYPCIIPPDNPLEAALSRTLPITPFLSHGIVVEGDPHTKEWQREALASLIDADNNPASTELLLDEAETWARHTPSSWAEIANNYMPDDRSSERAGE